MTDEQPQSKAHEQAVNRFIKTWEDKNGWLPRTYPFNTMTTDEINYLTDNDFNEPPISKD